MDHNLKSEPLFNAGREGSSDSGAWVDDLYAALVRNGLVNPAGETTIAAASCDLPGENPNPNLGQYVGYALLKQGDDTYIVPITHGEDGNGMK